MRAAIPDELVVGLVEEELVARRLSESSKIGMRLAIREFLAWAQERTTNGDEVYTKRGIAAYCTWLTQRRSKRSGERLAASTINGHMNAIRLVFSCLYRAGAIDENPAHDRRLVLPVPSGWRRRPLTRSELAVFLDGLDCATAQGLRDRALFELIYSSGLRVSEAAGLRVGDINFDRRIMIVRGKFDRERALPVSRVACDILKLHLGDKLDQADAWVFEGMGGPTKGDHIRGMSVSERFRSLLRRFDMDSPDISTHSIRHSTATHLLENGASIRHVQELLGHRNIESTVRYTHVMIDGLAKVFRRYHPREHELFDVVDEDYERRLSTLAKVEKPSYTGSRGRDNNARSDDL